MDELKIRRYPGYRRFEDTAYDRTIYFGRKREVDELLHLILAEDTVIFFGKSGAGKSSLLRAGLLDQLRQRGYFPFIVRFDHAQTKGAADYIAEVAATVETDCRRLGLEYELGSIESLWGFFKTLEVWRDNLLLYPILIIDQFEELFTLASAQGRSAFIEQLAGILRPGIPKSEVEACQARGERAEYRFSPSAPRLKVVLTLREDYVGHLDDMSDDIPGIFRSRYRMRALTREAARTCIVEPARAVGGFSTPPFEYAAEVVEAILDLLSRNAGDGVERGRVEAFQLQVLCQSVEDRVYASNLAGNTLSQVSMTEMGGLDGLDQVLRRFVEDAIASAAPSMRTRQQLLKLCADSLLSADGHRLSVDRDVLIRRHGVSVDALGSLTETRLLVCEPRLNRVHVELSHDTLAAPVRHLRSARREQAQRRWAGVGVALAAAVAIGGGSLMWQEAQQLESRKRREETAAVALAAAGDNELQRASARLIEAVADGGGTDAATVAGIRNASIAALHKPFASVLLSEELLPADGGSQVAVAASAPVAAAIVGRNIRIWSLGAADQLDITPQELARLEPPSRPKSDGRPQVNDANRDSADVNEKGAYPPDKPPVFLSLALSPLGDRLAALLDNGELHCWQAGNQAWATIVTKQLEEFDSTGKDTLALAVGDSGVLVGRSRNLWLVKDCGSEDVSSHDEAPTTVKPWIRLDKDDTATAVSFTDNGQRALVWSEPTQTLLSFNPRGSNWGTVLWSSMGWKIDAPEAPPQFSHYFRVEKALPDLPFGSSLAIGTIVRGNRWDSTSAPEWQVVDADGQATSNTLYQELKTLSYLGPDWTPEWHKLNSDPLEFSVDDGRLIADSWGNLKFFNRSLDGNIKTTPAVEVLTPSGVATASKPPEFSEFFRVVEETLVPVGTLVKGVVWNGTDEPRWEIMDADGSPTGGGARIPIEILEYLGPEPGMRWKQPIPRGATHVARASEDNRFMIGFADGQLVLMELGQNGATELSRWNTGSAVTMVSPDFGGGFASGHRDGSVRRWRPGLEGPLAEFICPGSGPIRAIDAHGLELAAVGDEGKACWWRTDSEGRPGGPPDSVEVVDGPLHGVALRANASILLMDAFGRFFSWSPGYPPALYQQGTRPAFHQIAADPVQFVGDGILSPNQGALYRLDARGRLLSSVATPTVLALDSRVVYEAEPAALAGVNAERIVWRRGNLTQTLSEGAANTTALALADSGRLLVVHAGQRLQVYRWLDDLPAEIRLDSASLGLAGGINAMHSDGKHGLAIGGGTSVAILDLYGALGGGFDWPRPLLGGPVILDGNRIAVADTFGVHLLDWKGDAITPVLAWPASRAPSERLRFENWATHFKFLRNSEPSPIAPDEFRHYFQIKNNEGLPSDFPIGTVVRGELWDGTDIPLWALVDDAGMGRDSTAWIHLSAVDYLGPPTSPSHLLDWDPSSRQLVAVDATGSAHIWQMDPQGNPQGQPRSLSHNNVIITNVRWLAGGDTLAIVGDSDEKLFWVTSTGRWTQHGVDKVRAMAPLSSDQLLYSRTNNLSLTRSRNDNDDTRLDGLSANALSIQDVGPTAYALSGDASINAVLLPPARPWWRLGPGVESSRTALQSRVTRSPGARSIATLGSEGLAVAAAEGSLVLLNTGWPTELRRHCLRLRGVQSGIPAQQNFCRGLNPDLQPAIDSPMAALKAGRPALAESLVREFHPQQADESGISALWWAVASGDVGIVNTLLEAGADVDAGSPLGDSPLALAAASGQLSLAQRLLEHGAKVDSADRAGLTPLARAVLAGHAEVARALLVAGADARFQLHGRGLLTMANDDGLRATLRTVGALGGHGGYWTIPEALLPEGLSSTTLTAIALEKQRDFAGAADAYLAAARAGDAYAASRLSMLHHFSGVPNLPPTEIAQLLQDRIDDMHVELAWAISLSEGLLEPSADATKARERLQARPELSPHAKAVLAEWQWNGTGGPIASVSALELARAAANVDHPYGLVVYGEMLLRGLASDLTPSDSEALAIFERLGDTAHPTAITWRGRLLEHGRGGPKDLAGALIAYEAARRAGNADAAFRSAWLYEHGLGVQADRVEAGIRYREALALGHAQALGRLRRLGWDLPAPTTLYGTR